MRLTFPQSLSPTYGCLAFEVGKDCIDARHEYSVRVGTTYERLSRRIVPHLPQPLVLTFCMMWRLPGTSSSRNMVEAAYIQYSAALLFAYLQASINGLNTFSLGARIYNGLDCHRLFAITRMTRSRGDCSMIFDGSHLI